MFVKDKKKYFHIFQKKRAEDKNISLECFEVFISNEILEPVVRHTNEKICRSRPQSPEGESKNISIQEEVYSWFGNGLDSRAFEKPQR